MWCGLTVRLLKDEHGPESNGLLAAGTDVDAETLHRARDSCSALGIESNVGSITRVSETSSGPGRRMWLHLPLALAAQVLDVLGVLLSKLLHLGVKDISNASLRRVSYEKSSSGTAW